jgi:hypothetical protein
MENRFDQLTKALAGEEPGARAPVSRREALRKVGLGLAGALLASLGLGSQALAAPRLKIGLPGGGKNPCQDYCRRFATRAERDRCELVCRSCPSTTLLCGKNGYTLVCCPGTCCGGVCTNLASDPNHCGACGRRCGSFPNVVTTCSAGTCTYACAEGWADCDGVAASGCEAYLAGDPGNCGACGHACAAGQSCCGGVCTDVVNDPNHCGGCGYNCAEYEGSSTCCGGVCSDLTTDPNHCGACGQQCSDPAAPHCVSGICSCPGTVCAGICTDLQWDPRNCGGCGNVCGGTTPHCVGGVCGCAGTLCYDGALCVDTDWDALNCGACGHQCQPLEHCSFGSCEGVG